MTINKLDTDGYWMVGSSHIYVPATPCKVEKSNVTGASTGRDEAGYLHISWIRRKVRKVYLTYKYLSGSELDYLDGLMQGKEFVFKFLDGTTVTTMNAYAAESSYEMYTYADGEIIYKGYTINVIEK